MTTLQDRLNAAKHNYDTLQPPGQLPQPGDSPSAGHRRWYAAAAVIALIAGASAVFATHNDAPVEVRTTEAPATTIEKSDNPQPNDATASYDPRITLDPPGPYTDGQTITIRFGEGIFDSTNSDVSQCAVIAGDGEWCDPLRRFVGYGTSQARVDRTVLTPSGRVDCESPTITCRLVITRTHAFASEVLRFDSTSDTERPRLRVTPGQQPGTAVFDLTGFEPDPTWTAYAEQRPVEAENYPPFVVRFCGYDASAGPAIDGKFLWDHGTSPDIANINCDEYRTLLKVEGGAPVELPVPANVLGYNGWTDCRVEQCVAVIVRRSVTYIYQQGGIIGGGEDLAAVLIDHSWIDPASERPALSVRSDGPSRAGAPVEIQVSGLPDAEQFSIGLCRVEDPWSCGYFDGGVGNGVHEIVLPRSGTDGCSDKRCFLELGSQGEGMPPLAVAPIDIISP